MASTGANLPGREKSVLLHLRQEPDRSQTTGKLVQLPSGSPAGRFRTGGLDDDHAAGESDQGVLSERGPVIAAPPRRRYGRSACFLCMNGAKHKHCGNCGAIVSIGKTRCGSCLWEGSRARTNHALIEPMIDLLREIFNPT